MIKIRNFVPSDLSRVMFLVAETFNQDYSPGFYLSMSNYWPDGFIIIKKVDVLAGFLLGTITDKDEVRILIMCIDKNMRAQGLGTELYREFVNRCTLRGIKRVVLEVRTSNKTAQKFYQRFGFETVCTLPRYYLDAENAYRLTKWL